LLASSWPLLVACGGENDDAQRALDGLNGGSASVRLREALEKGGGISFCSITPQAQATGNLVLTIVMRSEAWVQATMDPEREVRSEDVTTGGNFAQLFGTQAERDLREHGKPCRVSPADGTVSLR
jgi:hypothetical protein